MHIYIAAIYNNRDFVVVGFQLYLWTQLFSWNTSFVFLLMDSIVFLRIH